MEWLQAGGHPNFRVEENGLVSCEGRDKAVTWMNSTVGGRPIVPRTGYIVEINALWYNANKIMQDLSLKLGEKEESKKFLYGQRQ